MIFIAREAFGMTEIGSGLFMPIEATDMVGSGSCGVPSPFREARVADPDGKTVPLGEIGELVVRGAGILQGYYNKPEATGPLSTAIGSAPATSSGRMHAAISISSAGSRR